MYHESNFIRLEQVESVQRKLPDIINLRIHSINNVNDLKKIRKEWERLSGEFGNLMMTYGWFISCISTFCQPDKQRIYFLNSNESIKGIFPLCLINRFGTVHLEIPGTSELMEPASLIAQDDSSFEKLFEMLLTLKKPLVLKRLILKPSYQEIIERLSIMKSFLIVKNTTASQYIIIDSTWNEFEKQMKSSQRSRLRRFRKRLEQAGKVEVEVYKEDSERFREALDEAFRIEASGWKAKENTSVLQNKQMNSFFEAYISSAVREGILRLFLLKLNGKGIAMIIGAEYAQRFWTLKIGYDENWSRFAPGIILHHESIRWAFEQNLKAYEFLGTGESWIDTWTKKRHTYYTYRLFPKSFNGLFCLGIEGMKILISRVSSLLKLVKNRAGLK